jgi:hypothetical protein
MVQNVNLFAPPVMNQVSDRSIAAFMSTFNTSSLDDDPSYKSGESHTIGLDVVCEPEAAPA